MVTITPLKYLNRENYLNRDAAMEHNYLNLLDIKPVSQQSFHFYTNRIMDCAPKDEKFFKKDRE
jgi:hypothetical protein